VLGARRALGKPGAKQVRTIISLRILVDPARHAVDRRRVLCSIVSNEYGC